MLNTIIPKKEFPNIEKYNILDIKEEIVDLKDCGFIISPEYYNQGIKGALKTCSIRKTVADMLIKAKELLPKGYNFKIYDGWRPYSVQKALWDMYYEEVKNNPLNKNLSEVNQL